MCVCVCVCIITGIRPILGFPIQVVPLKQNPSIDDDNLDIEGVVVFACNISVSKRNC